MTAVRDAKHVIANAFEGCGEAWVDDTSGDRLAQVAADALASAGMLRRAVKPRTDNGQKPVVAIDLDGTLGPWHHHFACFLEDYTGKRMPVDRRQPFHSVDWDGSVPFWSWLGISKATYRQAKIAFRQGGFKRWMPAYHGADSLTRAVRKAGAEVWICTTRPYLRLDNIDPDTRHWLRRNAVQYDGVIFGDDKYRALCSIVGLDQVVCVFDDTPEQLTKANALGLNVVVRQQNYNRASLGAVVHDCQQATELITTYVRAAAR